MSAELKTCLVSALATTLADAVTYPIELVATMVKSANGKLSSFKVTNHTIKKHGLSSLYKGFSTVTYTAFFPNIAYFYCYEYLKKYAQALRADPTKPMPAIIPFVCSMVAETAFVMVMVPFDTIQTRMQLQAVKYNYRGLSHGITQIMQHEGFIRLFSACPLYIAQFLTYTPVQFTAYEWLKARRLQYQDKLSLIQSIYYTIVATSLAAVVTNPVNTLIVKFQVADFGEQSNKTWRHVIDIYKKSGFKEINKALGIRLLERNINGLCYLPIYEMAGQYFHSPTH